MATHDEIVAVINLLDHEAMCRAWRFSVIPGLELEDVEKVFSSQYNYYPLFKARFDAFGGFTPELSKKIGWDEQ